MQGLKIAPVLLRWARA